MTYDTIFASYASFVLSRTKPLESTTQNILHAAVGLATEAGEALDTAKKLWIYEQDLEEIRKDGQTHRSNLLEEVGDLLFYAQMLCNSLDISMRQAIIYNQQKLTKRYPVSYSNEEARQRKDKEV